jgi:hypothetical protein
MIAVNISTLIFFPARNDYGGKTDVEQLWSLIKSELISVAVS